MSGLPRLHTPKDIADALRVSEWWVKERARRREIPFVLAGGSYRFTDAHLAEIVAIFEQRPDQPQGQAAIPARRRAQQRPQTADPVVPLRARQPRRRRPDDRPPRPNASGGPPTGLPQVTTGPRGTRRSVRR